MKSGTTTPNPSPAKNPGLAGIFLRNNNPRPKIQYTPGNNLHVRAQ